MNSTTMLATVALGAMALSVNAQGGKYATVNGLKMYYEVRGTGKPLVLLHGAFGNTEGWATILPALEKNHQVIMVEVQGHGHTADRDKPLSIDQMADDTAELLKQLQIKQADVFGYSMGGIIALGFAVRHPEVVGKLAILGAYGKSAKESFDPELYKLFASMTPETFAPPTLKEPYDRMSPDPKKWPVLVAKIRGLVDSFKGFSDSQLKGIKAQTLIIAGDHDAPRVEHSVQLFRLIPNAQLAILPGGDHFAIFMTPDRVLGALVPFLDAPASSTKTEIHR